MIPASAHRLVRIRTPQQQAVAAAVRRGCSIDFSSSVAERRHRRAMSAATCAAGSDAAPLPPQRLWGRIEEVYERAQQVGAQQVQRGREGRRDKKWWTLQLRRATQGGRVSAARRCARQTGRLHCQFMPPAAQRFHHTQAPSSQIPVSLPPPPHTHTTNTLHPGHRPAPRSRPRRAQSCCAMCSRRTSSLCCALRPRSRPSPRGAQGRGVWGMMTMFACVTRL